MEKIYLKYKENGKSKNSVGNLFRGCLNALNALLEDIKNEMPEKLEKLKANLFKVYDNNENSQKILDSINLEEYSSLLNEKDLLNRSISAALEFLKFHKYNEYPIKEQIDIERLDFVNIYSLFEYNMIESLLAIMSHEEVIEYYKKLNDKFTISRRNPDNYVEDLKSLQKNFETEMEAYQLQDAILGMKEENKLILKVTKCKWAEAFENLDSELAYAMICAADIERAKSYNPNTASYKYKNHPPL